MLNGLMKSNGWFPTMFDDFFNTPSRTNRSTSMRTVTVTTCAVSSVTQTMSRTTYCLMTL